MIHLLETYKYLIVIPLAIVEGPILSVICGFLVTLGFFNFFVIYIVMSLGDIVGDAFFYYLGYKGKRFLKYFKITDEKMAQAKLYFKDNHKKALITSKLVHGIGLAGIIAAGAVHVPYKKFLKTCGLISFIQSLVLVILGVFFGHAYVLIGKYLDGYATAVSVLALLFIAYLLFKKYKNSIGTKLS